VTQVQLHQFTMGHSQLLHKCTHTWTDAATILLCHFTGVQGNDPYHKQETNKLLTSDWN